MSNERSIKEKSTKVGNYYVLDCGDYFKVYDENENDVTLNFNDDIVIMNNNEFQKAMTKILIKSREENELWETFIKSDEALCNNVFDEDVEGNIASDIYLAVNDPSYPICVIMDKERDTLILQFEIMIDLDKTFDSLLLSKELNKLFEEKTRVSRHFSHKVYDFEYSNFEIVNEKDLKEVIVYFEEVKE